MSHVYSPTRHKEQKEITSEEQMKEIMNERRWQYVDVGITDKVLKDNFNFLNDAVVIRSGAEGIPLMTTTGIYGPIAPYQKVRLEQGKGKGAVVKVIHNYVEERSLLDELKERRIHAKTPKKENVIKVQAKWVSGKDGGGLSNVGGSANVFGATGSLLVNETEIDFPVLDIHHKDFDETLAYYGAKILQPNESFNMGFDKPLFGMEYDTSLPGYIQDYVMKSYGGGGLFVEHHPFPHIWFPNPNENERDTNICRVLLGRIIESKEEQERDNRESWAENRCPERHGNKKQPEYHFTVFRFPSDGHAIAVDECCIHNDSFCNGKQVVFLANTDANTVALRETAPFQNIRISEQETPYK
ncbi:hypothetical protein [Tenacibaculum amylolyticum]|uniref:hypothetical protein n=1 Tax=Tenacibaculum amylolyticum TaxID=104269 RepID=UPI003892D61F